jgi:hypothetical protein
MIHAVSAPFIGSPFAFFTCALGSSECEAGKKEANTVRAA